MAENKIPVLTEVYKPQKNVKANKSGDASLKLTPELVEKVTAQIKTGLEAEIKEQVLDEIRSEIEKVREEAAASTQALVEASKEGDSSDITATVAAKVTAQVKPRLEAEITDFALDELRSEINKAREEIIAATQDFVDRTKADLKTDMPKMYQDSVNLAQINLTDKFEALQSDANVKVDASLASLSEASSQHQEELKSSFGFLEKAINENVQAAIRDEVGKIQEQAIQEHQLQLSEAMDGFLQVQGGNAEKTLLQKMQDYEQQLNSDYQEQKTIEIAAALEAIKQRIEESTQEQIGIMDTHVGTIQQETFAKLREDFDKEKEDAFNAAAAEIKTAFAEKMTVQSQEIREQFLAQVNGDLPDVQAVLHENILTILAKTIPDLEDGLRRQLTEELQQLLLKVKFVLPD